MSRKLTTEEFISKAQAVHGDRYGYDDVKYENNIKKVEILCKVHGPFQQKPANHLFGKGCIACGFMVTRQLSLEGFIEKARIIHGNKYFYENVQYNGAHINITILCKVHGPFQQSPSSHLSGRGCNMCGVEVKMDSIEEFIQKGRAIHGDTYDYSFSEYKNSRTKIKIICPKHGEFYQMARSHTSGKGCPNCRISKGEKIIREILNRYQVIFEPQKIFDSCRSDLSYPLRFDFFIPILNTVIEFDGAQHTIPVDFWGGRDGFMKAIRNDFLKNEYCERENIKLIRIPHTEKDIFKRLFQEGIIANIPRSDFSERGFIFF